MSDVELLRDAARLMRQRAQAATPSPTGEPYGWAGHSGTIGAAIYGGPAEGGYRTSTVLTVEEGCTACTQPSDADVQHITSWHPGVALAVADWLDFTAERAALAGALMLPYGAAASHAVAVARAYLGRDE